LSLSLGRLGDDPQAATVAALDMLAILCPRAREQTPPKYMSTAVTPLPTTDNGIGPYGGTLSGKNASFYCVDFSYEIFAKTSRTVNITNLANSAGYVNTRLKNQTTYLEIAWFLTQMTAVKAQTP
jgi:hypothetical protein